MKPTPHNIVWNILDTEFTHAILIHACEPAYYDWFFQDFDDFINAQLCGGEL